MIEKCYLVTGDSINPYYNLALEDYLMHHIPPDSMILYLWQNQNTVVIGKNQNAYKECHLQEMEYDHCYLARRHSGGGAVFHDLGNLNYTFLTHLDSYDINRQSMVIVKALQACGLNAQVTGRNDIEIEGRKVSGNAYLTEKEQCLHHGTIMWNVDRTKIPHYLNVSGRKIQARGVDSVQSRTANLTDFRPDLTLEQLKDAILKAAAEIYGPLEELPVNEDLSDLIEHYHSWCYLYGTISTYTVMIHDYYSFGELQMYVDMDNDRISKLDIYTDALDTEITERIRQLFEGLVLNDAAFRQRCRSLFDGAQEKDMAAIYQAIRKYRFN